MASATAAAAPTPDKADAAPAPSGGKKKKLMMIVGVVLALVLAAGVGTVILLKKRAAALEANGGAASDQGSVAAEESRTPPTFVPLDQFTVNLADRDQDRFAQVGLVFELSDSKVAEDIKTYMPAIRNAILLLLSHQTSEELNAPMGKEQLAENIRVAAARAMGLKVAPPRDVSIPVSPKNKPVRDNNPIKHVNYSAFIIQ
jgi:flagellar FliL protein